MISVSRPGRYEFAEYLYNRNENAKILSIDLETDGVKVSHEISVPEAKSLAESLLEWVREYDRNYAFECEEESA